MTSVISINPAIMPAAAGFTGTRMAVATLSDHLEAGYTVDRFLEPFPTVRREHEMALVDALKMGVARWASAA
jgi:uncharacterized protein (DUF433 family)